jgi:hypothetical protein
LGDKGVEKDIVEMDSAANRKVGPLKPYSAIEE